MYEEKKKKNDMAININGDLVLNRAVQVIVFIAICIFIFAQLTSLFGSTKNEVTDAVTSNSSPRLYNQPYEVFIPELGCSFSIDGIEGFCNLSGQKSIYTRADDGTNYFHSRVDIPSSSVPERGFVITGFSCGAYFGVPGPRWSVKVSQGGYAKLTCILN